MRSGRWRRVGERRLGLLFAVVLGVFGAYAALYYFFELTRDQAFLFGDFFALWSYGKILLTHPAAELYDPVRLHELQVALGMDAADHNPFPYPPVFLLMVWPLGLLPYGAAYVLWIGGTLALFLWAALDRDRPALSAALLLLAPVTTVGAVAGQSGFLAGALLAGGLRALPARPVLGGVLIGLLTYKPQLGLLVPVALLAAGQWRAIAAAATTTVALALLAALLFGPAIWTTWLHALPGYSRAFEAGSLNYHMMPTVLANLQMLGAPLPAAHAVQAVAAVGTAALVWACFRRGVSGPAIAALLAGTFLVTPHAFVYDLPMLGAAVVLMAGRRLRDGGLLTLPEAVILALTLAFPAFMLWSGPSLPLSTAALLACTLLAARMALRFRP